MQIAPPTMSGPAPAPVQGLTAPGTVQPNWDGDDPNGLDLSLSEAAPSLAELHHDANLAEALDDYILNTIAGDLLEGVAADIDSNADHYKQYEDGVKLLGLKPIDRLDTPFTNAMGGQHPLLLEAVVRFQANARAEMLPAAGPVRVQQVGDDPRLDDSGQRKQRWLNFYLTEVDEGYYPDFDQMLLLLPLHGSMFRKVYTDPLKRQPLSRYLTPFNLVVSYAETSLQSCNRVTQIEQVTEAELIKMQVKGLWRDIDLTQPMDEDIPGADITDRYEGRSPSSRWQDTRYTIYHVHCLLDLEGLEHKGEDGEPTGLPLPYIVTIEKESQKILRLTRNFEQGDEDFEPREWFSHYQYMPGLGFYGWGLSHLLGNSADAASTLRRQAINAFTLASFPGGFRAKGSRQENNDVAIGPCEFREIDLAGLPSVSAAVMPLPYRDPPQSFPLIMQEVVGAAQRLGGTADMAVGDGREEAPVGTTVALIEKATRVESAVIKRLHTAHRKELRLLSQLFSKEPSARYTYKVNGQSGVALAQDFLDNTDIVPVSDPNIPTQTQRLALAQAQLDLAQKFPSLINTKQALQHALTTMGASQGEINNLIQSPQQAQPLDPVSEFQGLMQGQPLKAGPEQVHAAHIHAHQAQLQMLLPMGNQPPVQAAMSALTAHIGEHAGLYFRQEIGKALGQPLPPAGPLPPQIEAQLSVMVAQRVDPVVQGIMQALNLQHGDGNKHHGMDPAEIQLQQQANQLKAQQLQQQQADSVRKAEAEARNAQIEIMRLEAQHRSDLASTQAQHLDRIAGARQTAAQLQDADRERELRVAQEALHERQHQRDHAADMVQHVSAISKSAADIAKAKADEAKAKAQAKGNRHAAS